MRTTNRRLVGPILALGVLVVALAAACGGDDDDPTATATTAPAESTTEATATMAPDDGDDGEDGDGAASAGQITIGDDTWELDPQQCDVFPGGVVSVWGFAVGDPDVEIVFDIFAPDEEGLSVSSSAANWSALSDDIEAQIDGDTITGTAMVAAAGGDPVEATFEFNCG